MRPRPLVVVSEALPEDWLAPLEAVAEVRIGLARVAAEEAARVRALLTMLTVEVDDALLDRFPALSIVSNMAVGVDNIDVEACTRRRIAVGHTPGVLTDATADLTLALMLASTRRIAVAAADAREGRWGTWSPTGWLGAQMSESAVGIIGMGQIGEAVARRCRAFGARIVYANPSPRPQVESDVGAVRLTLDELLAYADIVSLHVPLRPTTRHLLDARALARMKPSAHLVNTARGDVVDTEALVAALRARTIAGAALDVTTPEPLPVGHPLYALANCVVVPHVGSATNTTRRRMAHLACTNVVRVLEGGAPAACVNPDAVVTHRT
jgi:lactate dehydrogenase-like 2-hydroxyacid dehydrogenase